MDVVPPNRDKAVARAPLDWGRSTVGREFDIQLGKMLDAARNQGVSKPYLGNKAVQWGRIDVSDLPTVPMSAGDLDRYRLRRGDLLVCEGGEFGRAAIWEAPINECYFQKALHRLRSRNGYDPRLLLELLRYWTEQGSLGSFVSQTSIAHLTREKLAQVPLPLPRPAEQRAIADALTDVDALIGALSDLIAKKRDLRAAALQQLVTGWTRLTGFGGETELRPLGEVLTVRHGKSQHSVADSQGKYPILGTSGEIGRSDHWLYSRPSVLIGRKGTIDVPQYMDSPFWTIDTLFFTEIGPVADPKFMYYLFQTIPWRSYNEASGVPSLNASTIEAIAVSLPSLAEQVAIAAVLSDMDTEIEALEARLAKTRDLKQAMAQELLSGRTRLA